MALALAACFEVYNRTSHTAALTCRARKLPGSPTGQASQLKNTTGSSASPNWIDKTGFCR